MPITGESREVAIADLFLDAKNPRLPDHIGLTHEDQEALILFVAEEYDSLRIARSVAEFGYFPTEAPICIEEDELMLVVEGNRRVAALKILLSEELRNHEDLSSPEVWTQFSQSDLIPTHLTVLVVPNRQEVAPLVAYRHISGIEAWEPWAQARFVANLIDEQGAEFEEAASLVGETLNAVRRFYRDHAVLAQASENFDLDTSRAEGQFGIFTRALQDGGIRQYIGAPTPANVVRGAQPLDEGKSTEIEQVFAWIFGTPTQPKVIDESRDLSELGRVLSSGEPEAMRLLVEENDLPAAFAAAGGIKDRLLKNLRDATNSTLRARDDLPEYAADEDVSDSVAELRDAVESLDSED